MFSLRLTPAVLGLILLVASCRRNEPPPALSQSPARSKPNLLSTQPATDTAVPRVTTPEQDSALVRLLEAGRQFGVTEAEIRSNLGLPLIRFARSILNRQEAGIDSLVSLRYVGLEVTLYGIPGGQEFLVDLALTDSSLARRIPVPLLRTADEVVGLLGAPEHRLQGPEDLEVFSYETRETPDQIQLLLARGVVRRIDWTFYFD